MRTIKKSPNRRLYDTEVSRYITISDLRQLIIEGEEFEVVDVASGDDLTRAVQLQIGRAHVELQSHHDLVCRLLLEKKKQKITPPLNVVDS